MTAGRPAGLLPDVCLLHAGEEHQVEGKRLVLFFLEEQPQRGQRENENGG